VSDVPAGSVARKADYAKDQHDFAAAYFQHKETTAHAGLAIELALVSGLIAIDHWPPSSLDHLGLRGPGLALAWMVIVLVLLHLFVRHQVRLARWAALQRAATLRLLKMYAEKGSFPQYAELPPKGGETVKWVKKVPAWLMVVADHIVPIPGATLVFDQRQNEEPAPLAAALAEQRKEGTRMLLMEWFMALGSLLMGATSVAVMLIRSHP
jgi:hypothetical protein